jgi:hypothetical protein
MEIKEKFNANRISPTFYVVSEYPDKVVLLKEDKSGSYKMYDKTFSVHKAFEKNLESKILIYEDRMNGWFLNYGISLKNDPSAGFILLMICVSYLEGNQQFREGRISELHETGSMLSKALRRMLTIPKEHEEAISLFVNAVRHGFSHDGIPRKEVLISNNLAYIMMADPDKKILLINPVLFLDLINLDLELYISSLKNPDNVELRTNFERFWDARYG